MSVPGGQPEAPVGQNVTEPPPVGHVFRQLDHRFGVPESEGHARIPQGQMALFVQLHGASDGGPGRNRVHAHFVADESGLGDHVKIVGQATGAVNADGFIFRPHAGGGVSRMGDPGHAAASHRAGHAGHARVFPRRLVGRQPFTGELFPVLVGPVFEISGRQHPEFLDQAEHPRGPDLMEVFGVGRVHLSVGIHHGFPKGGLVRHFQPLGASDGDGLEVFGPHDGPDTGAARRASHVAHDAGKQHLVFSGRTDAGHLGFGVGLLDDRLVSVAVEVLPQRWAASRTSTVSSSIHR